MIAYSALTNGKQLALPIYLYKNIYVHNELFSKFMINRIFLSNSLQTQSEG